MASTYCVVVSGRVPAGFPAAARHRFDDVCVHTTPARTVIECSVKDQAQLRALLTQLWDVGVEVLLISRMSDETTRRNRHGRTQK